MASYLSFLSFLIFRWHFTHFESLVLGLHCYRDYFLDEALKTHNTGTLSAHSSLFTSHSSSYPLVIDYWLTDLREARYSARDVGCGQGRPSLDRAPRRLCLLLRAFEPSVSSPFAMSSAGPLSSILVVTFAERRSSLWSIPRVRGSGLFTWFISFPLPSEVKLSH